MVVEKTLCIKNDFPISIAGIIALVVIFCLNVHGNALAAAGEHGLSLSGMQVRVTSNGHKALFRLYDTVAAKEFYRQLPLTLKLENFRDAQWMFYPPERLNVTSDEAYHDGKKGELSYYAPWGDVFMLYKDFHAGDEMHRLGIGISGVGEIAPMSGTVVIERDEPQISGKESAMYIQVTAHGTATIYKLNNSPAAQALYAQLPLDIAVEDYGGKEKIFYPPIKLETSGTPRANAVAGTLAYYAPWGDVVMFYKKFGSASGLYELGHAVSGIEHIEGLSATIKIEKSSGP